MTKIDVYDTFGQVKACIAYEVKGRRITEFPATLETLEEAMPVTTDFPGWRTPTKGARSFEDLPSQAQGYIRFVEDFVKVPVTIVSVGSERDETVVRKNPWTRS